MEISCGGLLLIGVVGLVAYAIISTMKDEMESRAIRKKSKEEFNVVYLKKNYVGSISFKDNKFEFHGSSFWAGGSVGVEYSRIKNVKVQMSPDIFGEKEIVEVFYEENGRSEIIEFKVMDKGYGTLLQSAILNKVSDHHRQVETNGVFGLRNVKGRTISFFRQLRFHHA